ncbi:MAG TPA: SAM-dependent methyltransferase [Micromonosporaceae bacterium]
MADSSPPPAREEQPKIDTTVPHSARIWNYWLGGKDNFAVDREAGAMVAKIFPGMVDEARASRAFLGRVVRYLGGEAGIRQFLDIGTGLPTANNTHEIAQRVAPESRIVYVDNDPMVLAHARALLTSSSEGVTQYIDADVHDPDEIVRQAAETLDFSRPIAIMLMGIMGHIGDDNEVRSIIKRLVAAVPSGSYLALSDGANTSAAAVESMEQYNKTGALPYHLRSPEQLTAFFDGLELLEPGVVPRTLWRPDPDAGPPETVDGHGGVGRKP